MTRIILTAVGIGLMEKDWLWEGPRSAANKARMDTAQTENLPHIWSEMKQYTGTRSQELLKDEHLVDEILQRTNDPELYDEVQAMARILAQYWTNALNDKGSQARLKDSPPELASLSLLTPPLGVGDEVRLLHTETRGSAMCSAILATTLRLIYPDVVICIPRCLRGVQMTDIDRLSKEGFLSWALAIEQAQQDASRVDQCVLVNITGGYKGMAPLATLLAFGSGSIGRPIEVFYLYEEARALLFLPGSSLVTFNLDVFKWYHDYAGAPALTGAVPCYSDDSKLNDRIVELQKVGVLQPGKDGRCRLTVTGNVLLAVWQAQRQIRVAQTPSSGI